MMTLPLLALGATLASAAPSDNRGTVAPFIGGGATVEAPRFYAEDRDQLPMGCAGVDVYVIPDGLAQRTTHLRWAGGVSACIAPLSGMLGAGLGAGGQWGSRKTYLTAHMLAGLGGYKQLAGTRSYAETGLWLRSRAALGLRLPGTSSALEIGPSFYQVVPFLTEYEGLPASDGFGGLLTVDVTLTWLNVSPRRGRNKPTG